MAIYIEYVKQISKFSERAVGREMEIITQGIFGLLGLAFMFIGGFILGAVFEFHVLTRSES